MSKWPTRAVLVSLPRARSLRRAAGLPLQALSRHMRVASVQAAQSRGPKVRGATFAMARVGCIASVAIMQQDQALWEAVEPFCSKAWEAWWPVLCRCAVHPVSLQEGAAKDEALAAGPHRLAFRSPTAQHLRFCCLCLSEESSNN